jgi:hypothetical protein
MTERARDFLKTQFRDGERPSGSDFADLIDSVPNKQTDNVSIDAAGNLLLNGGVRLGDSSLTNPGGLRFNNNQLQVFTGGAWTNVSGGGGGGGFQAVPSSPQSDVVRDSKVGIGAFTAAAPPTFRLEVPLGSTGATADQVRFGNLVCSNGAGISFQNFAAIAHQTQAALNVNNNFALRQASTGEVQLNAPANQPLSLRQGGLSVKLGVSANGNVIVGSGSELANIPNPPGTALFQVAGDAFKNQGSANWLITSDARLKEDVRDLDAGLAALRQVRPVRFRYNGRAGTSPGRPGVGVLAQEIETVLPETVQRASVPDDPALNDLRVFDSSMLTYVLINAVKELAARVEQLEQALAAATAAADTGSVLA